MIASFSVLHRSHVLFPAFLGLVRFTISHVILYCLPSSFRDQIFLESSDDNLSFSFENEDLLIYFVITLIDKGALYFSRLLVIFG